MDKILQSDAAAKLPVRELTEELHTFLEPLGARLPEKRLRDVEGLAVQGNHRSAITGGDGDGRSPSA